MKFKTTFFSIFTIIAFGLNAQINIGSLEKPTSRSGGGELKAPDLKKIKRSTLVIFYGDKDSSNLEAFEKAAQSWTFGKIKLDNIANQPKYARKRGFSFATLETEPVFEVNQNIGTKTEVSNEVYLHFWTPKGKDKITFARIDLFADYATTKKLVKAKKPDLKRNLLYKEGTLLNWGPGFMKLYFKNMSDLLETGTISGLKEDFEDPEALKSLDGSVLFYPEYVLTKRNLRTNAIEEQVEAELFENYPFEKEMMLNDAFDNFLLEDENESDYVLIYTQCGAEKHYSIFTTGGELIFHEHETKSYNLDDGDLKKIIKAMK